MASSNRSDLSGGTCPFLNVLSASENGVVVESQRAFDVGAAVTIGFHVVQSAGRSSSFISAESIVVDSQPEVSRKGEVVFRVTLMFSDISPEDRHLLMQISPVRTASRAPEVPEVGLN